MKKIIHLLLLFNVLILTSCGSNTISNESISEKENIENSSTYNQNVDLSTNYNRSMKILDTIKEMSNLIALAPGDKKQPLKQISYHHFENSSFWGEGDPEIKGFTEPLAICYSIIEYYIQHDDPNYPVFDKTFYTKWIDGITGKAGYYRYIEVRDFPYQNNKMLCIRRGSTTSLVLLDENGRFNKLEISRTLNRAANPIDGGFSFFEKEGSFILNVNIETDGYLYYDFAQSDDFINDAEKIFNHYIEECGEHENYSLPTGKLLLEAFLDLHRDENNNLDFSDLLVEDYTDSFDITDENAVDITDILQENDSYLSMSNLRESFMSVNYMFVVDPIQEDYQFVIEDNVLKSLDINHWTLLRIPSGVTSIEGLLSDHRDGDSIVYPLIGVLIPDTVTFIKDGCFDDDSFYHVSHIFVDQAKESCPFKEQLDALDDVSIYYKDEYILSGGVPVPAGPHKKGETQNIEE